MTSTAPAPEGKRRPEGVRRTLIVLGVALAVVVGGIVAVLGDRAVSEKAAKEKNCCWEEGVTPDILSLGSPLPSGPHRRIRRAGPWPGRTLQP
ncbi:hypothetical protein GCM10010497_14560 [Streptomyces cinereoruber]|uniref:Uncharacterized protein n=1 Tax=Streptomyces cinereoruber TaxID=67260 RepID=A0AAV4KE62_9ACTN|nr:hypothetical protein GCM10010497_14560 [Streptomyces cinereoruber]